MLAATVLAVQASLSTATRLVQIGPDFWNVRGNFYIGPLNIGTQMSIIRIPSGKFVVVDTVELDAGLKAEIDALTRNGTRMDAIIATHPFHTTYFPAFYAAYPKVPFYGTPRHLRIQPNIPWAGSMYDCANRQRWNPSIRMRIPAGAEFVAPTPESSNHFTTIHVFHPASRVVHIDDTVLVDTPMKGDMLFHPALLGPGLYHTAAAPNAFRDWVAKYINDWNFDTIAAAHNGVRKGGAKAQLTRLLRDSSVVFDTLTAAFKLSPTAGDAERLAAMIAHEAKCAE